MFVARRRSIVQKAVELFRAIKEKLQSEFDAVGIPDLMDEIPKDCCRKAIAVAIGA